MTVPLTLDQALRLLPTVAGIARAGERLTAEGHQRHALAIAARRAANEIGIAAAAAAVPAFASRPARGADAGR